MIFVLSGFLLLMTYRRSKFQYKYGDLTKEQLYRVIELERINAANRSISFDLDAFVPFLIYLAWVILVIVMTIFYSSD